MKGGCVEARPLVGPAFALLAPGWELEYAAQLELMNYPDANGPRSAQLMPEASAGFPKISSNGRVYDFTVRTGFTKFSAGRLVTAASFEGASDYAADGIPPSAYATVAGKYGVNKSRFFVRPLLAISYLAGKRTDQILPPGLSGCNQISKQGTRGEPFDIADEGWVADYADPYDFVNVVLYGGNIQDANNNNYRIFVSKHFGCFTYSNIYGNDIAAACVK